MAPYLGVFVEHVEEMIPHLWLGDSKAAEHVPPYVSLIVNCTRNIPFYCEGTSNIRIPVDDREDMDQQRLMLKYWKETDVFDQMRTHIMQEKDVLVHCQMGRQRSAATIAAFLMTSGLSIKDAIQKIKSKKKEAFFPKVNFEYALSQMEKMMNVRTDTPNHKEDAGFAHC